MLPLSLIFPGQGTQTVGMGKNFYETCPKAKELFDRANQIINGLNEVTFFGPQEILTSTAFCQPAIFTTSMAALEVLKTNPEFNTYEIKFVAGLSLGEYSALCASGALSFEETLKLIERRSFFMEEACKLHPGKMAAVLGFEKEKIVAICREVGAEVANFNSPEQIVITGQADKVEAASKKITEAGAKRVMPLDVSGGFHSSLMKGAEEKFRKELDKVKFSNAKIPIVSNVDAKPVTDSAKIKENLARQITSSVQWVDTINFISANGVKDFIEVGPGSVLKGLLRKINKDLVVSNI